MSLNKKDLAKVLREAVLDIMSPPEFWDEVESLIGEEIKKMKVEVRLGSDGNLHADFLNSVEDWVADIPVVWADAELYNDTWIVVNDDQAEEAKEVIANVREQMKPMEAFVRRLEKLVAEYEAREDYLKS